MSSLQCACEMRFTLLLVHAVRISCRRDVQLIRRGIMQGHGEVMSMVMSTLALQPEE